MLRVPIPIRFRSYGACRKFVIGNYKDFAPTEHDLGSRLAELAISTVNPALNHRFAGCGGRNGESEQQKVHRPHLYPKKRLRRRYPLR